MRIRSHDLEECGGCRIDTYARLQNFDSSVTGVGRRGDTAEKGGGYRCSVELTGKLCVLGRFTASSIGSALHRFLWPDRSMNEHHWSSGSDIVLVQASYEFDD